ncbi:MAG: contractile injection system protein, VgrG/Pvc8 family [Sandaracinaceae bacterium]|nr:contractile injection system protein, VgrG/Pvc8 family [Sandaracinaceae bacterium]
MLAARLARARLPRIVRTVIDHGLDPRRGTFVEVSVEPAMALLALRQNTRMFQEKTAPQILEAVLGEALSPYGRSVQLELSGSYARREHCLQYQESDLDFVHRLMEEEGIAYAFDLEGDVEVLVLRDDDAAYPPVTSLRAPLRLTSSDLYLRDEEPITSLTMRLRHTTTSVVVTDWDWTRGGDMRVGDERRGTDALGRDRESYEHGLFWNLRRWDYSTGPRRYQENDAAHQANVRRQAHAVGAMVAEGTSRVIGLWPGTTFELTGHPTLGMDGEYLVTSVVHVSGPEPGSTGGGQAEGYHNRFECIPLGTPHRPTRPRGSPASPASRRRW